MPAPRRLLLPALLSVALLAAVSVIRRSLACPIEPPQQPLRTLYKLSARVIVARVMKSEMAESDEDSMVMKTMKTSLEVTNNLKGDGEYIVQLYHMVWVSEGAGVPDNFTPGNRLLLFLDKREEGGYEIDDENYGVKKLSDEDLKVYVERIEELAEIMKKDPPDNSAIVEWLVRCAEERATRWEGAYELKLSASAIEREKLEKEQAEKGKADASVGKEGGDDAGAQEGVESAAAPSESSGEAQEAGDGATPEDASAETDEESAETEAEDTEQSRYTEPDATLVAQLTDNQKRRLADALFGAKQIGKGEDALLSVVKDFKDSRLSAFIIAQLRRVENDAPFQAENWLGALAESLKNESLTKLVETYTNDATYYEEEKTADTDAEANRSTAEIEANYQAAIERATRKRASMLKDLLSQFERLVASGEVALN
jgi:hypothetical protein